MNAGTCEVQNGGCEDICVDTAHGPRCSCSPGLLLNDTDMHTCIGERSTTCLQCNEYTSLPGVCAYAQQQCGAARFSTSLRVLLTLLWYICDLCWMSEMRCSLKLPLSLRSTVLFYFINYGGLRLAKCWLFPGGKPQISVTVNIRFLS